MRSLLFLLPVLLAGPGCGAILHLPVEQTGTANVEGNALAAGLAEPLAFGGLGSLNLSESESLANRGVDKSKIRSVQLKKAHLRVVSPTSQDLSFLRKLSLSLRAAGQPDLALASGQDFGAVGAVDLTVTDADLLAYVTADSMSVESEASGRPPPQDTQLAVDLTFDVGADLGGLLSTSR